jgi:probable HAF family extracellular repeat protein
MSRFLARSSASFGMPSTAIVFFFFLGGLQAVYAGPIYSVQILGSISGAGTVSAINSSGVAVGFITDASGHQVPVSFNGQTNSLGGVGQANGINTGGTIIGTTYLNGSPTVTEWSNGQATNLGITGYGTAINNSGQVVGAYTNGVGQSTAFDWNNGTLVNLGTLNGDVSSSAYAINSKGQIVGTSMSGTGVFTAFFSNGTGMTNLCPSCSSISYAEGINSAGTAVGSYITGGYLHAAEYSGGSVVDLGTLGGSQSAAYGIDDTGDIVGDSYVAGNGTTHAFLYSNNVMIDLNSLLPITSGWTITAAYGIDNVGDIVGVGTLSGQTYAVELTSNSQSYASRATTIGLLSVPEPAPIFLTAGGLAFISRRFFRRRSR